MAINQDEPINSITIVGEDGEIADVKPDGSGDNRLKVDALVTNVSPNDFLSKVTSNDTTGDYLLNKIIAGSSKLSVTEINDGGDEDLSIDVVEANLTITASQVSDFDTEVSNNSSVTANTAKVTNATHTGEVTGSGALTVDKTAISNKTLVTAAATDTLLIGDASDTDNLKKVTAQSIADLGGGGSGDYSDGGEAGGADRTLGNTDNFALSFLTNSLERLKILASGIVQISSSIASDYLVKIQNTNATGHGLQVKAGEVDGDIILDLEDSNGTFNILQVEADQGYIIHGKTYSQTITDNGVAYGYDNQLNATTSKDINTQFGMYRVGGEQPWQELTNTSESTTSSTSYTLVPSMSYTSPNGGTYIVTFSASGRAQSALQEVQYALFNNGTKVGHSERDYGWDTSDPDNEDYRHAIHTQAVITVTAGQAIEARFKTNISTCRIFERSMILQKVRAN